MTTDAIVAVKSTQRAPDAVVETMADAHKTDKIVDVQDAKDEDFPDPDPETTSGASGCECGCDCCSASVGTEQGRSCRWGTAYPDDWADTGGFHKAQDNDHQLRLVRRLNRVSWGSHNR